MKKAGIASSIILLLLLVTLFSIGKTSLGPYIQAEKEAVEIAEKQAGVKSADHFYWYNGNETYFTVVGKNEKNQSKIVIIQQGNGKVTIYDAENTLSESDVYKITWRDRKPKKVLEARIGLEDGKPIWEVSYKQENGRIGYYILSLQTGEWIRSIENI